jgi:hypothetical protein
MHAAWLVFAAIIVFVLKKYRVHGMVFMQLLWFSDAL